MAYRGGRRSLSTRYQLAENVRAVRLVVPVIILDTMVTLVDLISSRFFDVGMMFDAVKCSNKNYVTTFLICRLVGPLMQPVSVITWNRVRATASLSYDRTPTLLGRIKRGLIHLLDFSL
ncbi:unnamed protein product [Heligmosomoides polygyrus]|uniref:Uncharacterized protein n=1 Tax=Heligmosomoides polygyrus TaxID=6339 RepID=A0A3P8E0Z2_HELPZ|nr:unnamed protein product [Heligmosomoides polygyrus]